MKCICCGEETENIIHNEKGMLNMKCIYCGEETENIIDNEYVCLNCMNKLYVPCANCGELHDKEKMTCTDIGYVCSECLESDFTRCFECGEYVENEEGTDRTFDGKWRCYECLDKRKELMRGICGVMVKSKRRRLRKIYISLIHNKKG